MIQEIAEHSVDLSLLPPKAKILDIGCLGFGFTDAMTAMGHNVWPVDIQTLSDRKYFRCGIYDYNGFCTHDEPADRQATKISQVGTTFAIPCWTLAHFSKNQRVDFWDVVKIDVEGAEYKIIMTLEKAPAKQLSIEFHLHTGIYNDTDMRMMEDKLKALGYIAARHVYEPRHCAGHNYWDSLFILK